jgi:hypothetical protein
MELVAFDDNMMRIGRDKPDAAGKQEASKQARGKKASAEDKPSKKDDMLQMNVEEDSVQVDDKAIEAGHAAQEDEKTKEANAKRMAEAKSLLEASRFAEEDDSKRENLVQVEEAVIDLMESDDDQEDEFDSESGKPVPRSKAEVDRPSIFTPPRRSTGINCPMRSGSFPSELDIVMHASQHHDVLETTDVMAELEALLSKNALRHVKTDLRLARQAIQDRVEAQPSKSTTSSSSSSSSGFGSVSAGLSELADSDWMSAFASPANRSPSPHGSASRRRQELPRLGFRGHAFRHASLTAERTDSARSMNPGHGAPQLRVQTTTW